MNNKKLEITKYVMNCLEISDKQHNLKNHLRLWWKNTRQKNKGGLALTGQGFAALSNADIRYYRINFAENLEFESKIILGLDNFIDCPFYITKKEIYVFDEFTAVQMILFEGNIKKFIGAKLDNSKLD